MGAPGPTLTEDSRCLARESPCGDSDVDVSPEILLGVRPSFLATSNGEHAWRGRMFYRYTACTLLLLYLQIGVGYGEGTQGHATSKPRNKTGAGQEWKLPPPGNSPTARSHHPPTSVCFSCCCRNLPSRLVPSGLVPQSCPC